MESEPFGVPIGIEVENFFVYFSFPRATLQLDANLPAGTRVLVAQNAQRIPGAVTISMFIVVYTRTGGYASEPTRHAYNLKHT